jgi:transposase
MKEQKRRDKITIGLDLGDRRHRFCVLGRAGEVVEEGSLLNERAALNALIDRYPAALVVMEAGCHSPWVSPLSEATRM